MGVKELTPIFREKEWPHGQAVKTPPFHGGNMGSNPVGVTLLLDGRMGSL